MKLFKTTTSLFHLSKSASTIGARRFTVFVLVVSMVSTTLLVPGAAQSMAAESQLTTSVAPPDSDHTAAASPSLPLMFIENVGQFDERAHFQVHRGNTTLYLADDALWVTVTEPPSQPDFTSEMEAPSVVDQETEARTGCRVNLKLSFAGANPHPRLEPFDRLETQVSFFTGSDPAQWHTDVPAWGGVRYMDLYPGVDLEIASQNGGLAQRLVARDRSSLQNVHLRVEGVDNLTLENDHLRLTTALGDFTLPLPTVEGAVPDAQPAISNMERGMFEVSAPFASTLSFAANSTQTACISNLSYSTYLGGSGNDIGYDIAMDSEGNAYVTGQTSSTDFPTTTGAYDTTYNGGTCDVLVAKLSADGSTLLYSTYLGGNSEDTGGSIAVDDEDNAYITGHTYSTDFPTTDGVWDRDLSGGRDAFVAKLNADGNDLLYSTYLGGDSWDYGKCIAADDAGNAFVGGFTHCNFPTTPGAAQETCGGSGDGFAVKLSLNGSTLLYSTYLGGYSWESIDGIAIDDAGNAYLASHTHSTDFPTTPGAWDRICDNCQPNVSTDGAVAKLSADGSEFIYSTLIGGSTTPGGEAFVDIAVDDAGNAYVTGDTSSTDYPATVNALQPSFGDGDTDAVVTRLNADGSALLYSTYLGGSGSDKGYGIAVESGNAYVTGETSSSDFPTTPGAFDTTYNGDDDAFVIKLDPAGSGASDLVYGTYLGGSSGDNGRGIAVDGSSSAYVTGDTSSSDFPTTPGAFDTTYNGGDYDAFVAKIWLNQIALTISPPETVNLDSLVYIPVELQDVDSADDIRGVQFSIQVTDTTVLTPAGNLPIRLGDLFPGDSYTYTVCTEDGWDFMLNAPLSPTEAISGTGVVAEFPFYAQAAGCVGLDFDTHILVNGAAQPVDHQAIPGWICVLDRGSVVGTTYLQSRETGHYTDTLVVLAGPGGTLTTTDADGNFALTDVPSGIYTAHFTHTLFVHAVRHNITVTPAVTTTMPEVGLWAGDLDMDGDVQDRDWYICAAASIPVDDPAFDINDDGVTNVQDCTVLASNIGRSDMPITNPPKGTFKPLADDVERLTAAQSEKGQLALVPQDNEDMMLRAVGVSGTMYAVGTRLSLPAGITVNGVDLKGAFTGGFLRWHQENDKLYIVAAPPKDVAVTQDTDVALMHITDAGAGEVEIEAANIIVPSYSIFLPIVMQNAGS